MKKTILFIFTFGIIFSLYNIKAFAYSQSDYQYIAIVRPENSNYYQIIGTLHTNTIYLKNVTEQVVIDKDKIPVSKNIYYLSTRHFETINDAIQFLASATNLYDAATTNGRYDYLITIKGSTVGPSNNELFFHTYQDFLDYINPPASWWDDVADEFERQLGIDQEIVDPISEFLYYFWSWLFPQDEEEETPDIVITETPTVTPLPTQIPYETFIDPNSGQIIYRYEISGTPTESPLPPPVQPIIITPDPGYGIVTPSRIVYPDEGLQDIIDNIDDNLGEYQQGLDTIGQSFSVLPVKWFVFFGIPAAIILIAGVIKSLLG